MIINGKRFSADDIVCDICGKSTKNNMDDFDYIELKVCWGYNSSMDGEYHEAQFCENCYKKIKKFIESLGGEINIVSGVY